MDEIGDQAGPGASAHTTSRRSARSRPVEIITRGERRRSWSVEQKREIVAESFGPELTPTEVARKHAISSGQLYTWRRQLLGMQSAMVTRVAPRFAEVAIDRGSEPAAAADLPKPSGSPPAPPRPAGLIEIILPNGAVLRVDAHVDSGALRQVLRALGGR